MSPGALSAALAALLLGQAPFPDGWTAFTSTRGGYSAAFPARPNEVARTVKRADASVTMATATLRNGPVSYTIASGELDEVPGNVDALLDSTAALLIQTVKGAPATPSPIELEGHPGRAFESTIPRNVMAGGGILKGRVYLVGNRLFELTAVQPAGGPSARPQDADAFLEAFKPTELPAPRRSQSRPAVAKAEPDTPKAEPVPSPRTEKAEPPAAAPAIAQADRQPSHPGWQIFRPQEGGISVELPPGQPQRIELTQDTPLGKVTARTYGMTFESRIYQLVITDAAGFEEGSTSVIQYLTGVRVGMFNAMGATLESEEKLDNDGLGALEAVASISNKPGTPFAEGGSLKMRSIVSGGFVIQAITSAPEGTPLGDEADTFVSSMRLEKGAAGANAAATPSADRPSGLTVTPPGGQSINIPLTKGQARDIDGPAPALAQGWVEYKRSDGSFSAAFPNKPDERKQDVPLPDGRKIAMTILGAQDSEKGICLLAIQDMPPGTINNQNVEISLDGAVQGMARPSAARVTKVEKIRLGGLPGRDAQLDIPDGPRTPGGALMFARIVASGDRLYLLTRSGKKDSLTLDQAMTFLDSFRLAEK
jgi:hypothetical protein